MAENYDISLLVNGVEFYPPEIRNQINIISTKILDVNWEEGNIIICFELEDKKEILECFNLITDMVIDGVLISYLESDIKLLTKIRRDNYSKPQLIFDINHPKTISFKLPVEITKFV